MHVTFPDGFFIWTLHKFNIRWQCLQLYWWNKYRKLILSFRLTSKQLRHFFSKCCPTCSYCALWMLYLGIKLFKCSDYFIKTKNNNIWLDVNNNVFGHKWGDWPIIFMSDTVKSVNYWQMTSWWQAIYYFISYMLLLVLIHREMKTSIKWSLNHSSLWRASWLCYCYIMHTHVMMSFWLIAFKMFLGWLSCIHYQMRFSVYSQASM